MDGSSCHQATVEASELRGLCVKRYEANGVSRWLGAWKRQALGASTAGRRLIASPMHAANFRFADNAGLDEAREMHIAAPELAAVSHFYKERDPS